jgi:predicted nucleic acid-binding protein
MPVSERRANITADFSEDPAASGALLHRATLVTFNQDDFADVRGLSLLVWPSK